MLCLSGFELYSRWVPLIIEVMSSYHWPYLPKRLNVKLDFIQLRASLRKKMLQTNISFPRSKIPLVQI